MTVEELKVILELETKGFNKQAEAAKRSLNDTEKAATSLKDRLKKIFGGAFAGLSTEANKAKSEMANSMSGVAKESEKVNASLGKTRSIMRDLKLAAFGGRLSAGLVDATAEAKSYMQELIGCEQAVDQLSEILKGCDPGSEEYAEGSQKVAEYAARIDELTQKLESMPNFGTHGLFQDTGQISNIRTLKAEIGGLRDFMSGIRSGFAEVFQVTPVGRFATRVGSAFTGVKRFITGAKNDIGTFGKKVLDAGKHFGIFGRRAGNAGSSVKNFIKSALGIGSLVVLFNKLKSAVSEGFNNLAQYSGQAGRSLTQLKGSLTQVKNSLAVAFAPIVTAIAPYVQTLVNLITTACNALAQFFGALTGQKTVTIATSGLGDISTGAGSAASATNDANDAAKKYQKTLMGFDQINKLDDQSGSSGSGGSGGGGAGGVGGAAGFSTTEIGNVYSGWAERIKEAWANADFTDIGAAVADKLNNALANIPWDKIRSTCNKVATSIGTFINGFVKEFDWGQLARTISYALETAMDTVSTLIQTIDWAQIGRSVVKFIVGIDWAGLFKSASNLAGSIVGGIAAFIAGAVEEAFVHIKEYFTGKIDEAGGNVVLGFLNGIKDGIKSIGTWIKTNIFDPFIEGFKKAFGISSPSTVMKEQGGYIMSGLLSGLTGGLQSILEFFGGLVSSIAGFFKDPVGTIKFVVDKGLETASGVWNSIQDSEVVKTLKEKGKNIIDGVKSTWTSIKDGTALKTLAGKITDTFTSAKTKFDNLKTKTATVTLKASGKIDSNTKTISNLLNAKKSKTFTFSSGGGGKITLMAREMGGLFMNGHWKPVTAAANGGSFSEGQAFIARERGPEMVGTIGRHSAVVNNGQIVASIADGVYRAVVSAMAGSGKETTLNVTLAGDAGQMFRVIRKEAQNYTNATGLSPFPV